MEVQVTLSTPAPCFSANPAVSNAFRSATAPVEAIPVPDASAEPSFLVTTQLTPWSMAACFPVMVQLNASVPPGFTSPSLGLITRESICCAFTVTVAVAAMVGSATEVQVTFNILSPKFSSSATLSFPFTLMVLLHALPSCLLTDHSTPLAFASATASESPVNSNVNTAVWPCFKSACVGLIFNPVIHIYDSLFSLDRSFLSLIVSAMVYVFSIYAKVILSTTFRVVLASLISTLKEVTCSAINAGFTSSAVRSPQTMVSLPSASVVTEFLAS